MLGRKGQDQSEGEFVSGSVIEGLNQIEFDTQANLDIKTLLRDA